ncbi:MAG: tetracycline resistance ribosomal protection protein TetB(P), partial [Lachnospiraceae bacterium]|nr:tetracycline resistance ribosomal protection protein TetB(P) [Lachnospiraceae bacterium]
MAKRIVSGILAHVDAGKTTLLEALLYESGTVRSPGSVDRKNSNLDTWTQEKDRGITIFSKQTVLNFGGVE